MVICLGIYLISYLYIFADAKTPPKSVNLAVETSFQFKPEDLNKKAIELRQFLDKIEQVLKPRSLPGLEALPESKDMDLPFYRNDPKSGVITTFLSKLGATIIHYEEQDVISLATALRDEVTKTYLSNQAFQEMLTDVNLQAFLLNSVTEWAKTDPLKLKVEIAKYVTNTENSGDVAFFRNINQFFVSDQDAFEKLIHKYVKAKRTKNFARALSKTLLLIIQRYSELDDSGKQKFRSELDKLTDFVAENYKHRLSPPKLTRRPKTEILFDSVKDFRQWESKLTNGIQDVIDKATTVAYEAHISKPTEIPMNHTIEKQL